MTAATDASGTTTYTFNAENQLTGVGGPSGSWSYQYGPAGYGSQGFISAAASPLPYRVDFENDPTATAPAQQVVVTDQLDANLDWKTLQFTAVGFGDNIITIPANTQHYQTTVAMTYNGQPQIGTNQVDPHDPSKGTDPSKECLNTIDAVAPTNTVSPLPAATLTRAIPVSWSGQDDPGGSGLASYDVYVSDNGGAFQPWLTGTTQTSATFTGQPGHSYGFFSVATDNVGNRQTGPASAQASTAIPGDPPIAQPANPAPGSAPIDWQLDL